MSPAACQKPSRSITIVCIAIILPVSFHREIHTVRIVVLLEVGLFDQIVVIFPLSIAHQCCSTRPRNLSAVLNVAHVAHLIVAAAIVGHRERVSDRLERQTVQKKNRIERFGG